MPHTADGERHLPAGPSRAIFRGRALATAVMGANLWRAYPGIGRVMHEPDEVVGSLNIHRRSAP
ncbi:hypothetical protein BH23GEM9_BH23GEM9_30020 [soil metagenome]